MSTPIKKNFPILPNNPLLDSLASSSSDAFKRESCRELFAQASSYFSNLPSVKPVDCSLRCLEPSLILNEIFIKRRFKGLCIGELHNDPLPKKLIIEHFPQLREMGVRILFLEHLKYDLIQSELDDWYNDPKACLPASLQQDLQELDRKCNLLGHCYSYTQLVLKAKEANLRIVAIDTSISAMAGISRNSPLDQEKRILGMNYTAKTILDKEAANKYLVLTGVDHASATSHAPYPGIGELMQCPTIIAASQKEQSSVPIVYHNPSASDLASFPCDNLPTHVHSIILLHDRVK